MIVIVTTISVYLAVYKDVPLDDPDDDAPKKPGRLRVLLARARKREAVEDAKEAAARAEEEAKPPSVAQ